MKFRKNLTMIRKNLTALVSGSLLCSTLLFGGCVVSEASTTCAQTEDGLTIAVTFKAPTVNDAITYLALTVSAPTDVLADQLGMSVSELQEAFETSADQLKNYFAGNMGIDSRDVSIRLNRKNAEIRIAIPDVQAYLKKAQSLGNLFSSMPGYGYGSAFGASSYYKEEDLKFSKVKEQMEDELNCS